jgi:hypothetical protein
LVAVTDEGAALLSIFGEQPVKTSTVDAAVTAKASARRNLTRSSAGDLP